MSSNDAPSVQRLGGGEQPVPGEVGGVEGLAALLAGAGVEGVELVADAVSRGEQPALREQAAFLGEEQEDHPHHHRDGGLVDLVAVGGQRVRLAAVAGRRAPPRTCACTSSSTARRTWVPSASVISSAAATESPNSSVSRSSGLPPIRRRRRSSSMNALRAAGASIHGLRVDDAGGDHGLRPGADDRPPAPVGDHADRDSGGPQQLFHPVDRAGRPAVGERVPQRVDRIDDEDQRAGQCRRAPARRSGVTVTE